MNQRKAHRGGVTFCAWTVSIAVHIAALGVFGFIRFSQTGSLVAPRPVPTATINQVNKFAQAASIIPKPKVKRPAKKVIAEKSVSLLPADKIFDDVKPVSKDLPSLSWSSVSASEFSQSSSSDSRDGVEFFGSFTAERRVYYVVDCSGSMQGVFGLVKKRLIESIEKLQPDQYFYIIFFGDGRLYEFGEGALLRATGDVKSAGCEFVDSIVPRGQTNALAAFERTAQVRGSVADSSAVVYFLTDGFELTSEGEQRFSQKLEELLAKFAPRTRINTIGFWPQSSDREMLRAIAEQSNGEFILIDNY